ncbi:hypothetical protein [Ornithinimicrobium sp. INDO-MA30-4]|uniref:hypothetical protein n=1 Tax=Ornithinimicrobium sp. INDO-MA30-4 TaxID=2908651 RepID=UPI001F276228|nr:hypothetical protein [Ornithinimicrobium sp. INDO-MA30-4]UJH69852.1 hypothetical protein L0A91_11405 [Ornithinimicrobium sp. INDO-MA30-4]
MADPNLSMNLPADVPSPQAEAIRELLGTLPEHRQTTFVLRARRWWPTLVSGLSIYPDPEAAAGRALELAAGPLRSAATICMRWMSADS